MVFGFVKWLEDGDSNTKFFHNYVKLSRKFQRISSIKNSDGVWLSLQEDIGEEAVKHFSSLFQGEVMQQDCSQIIEYLPSLITTEHNLALGAISTDSEIKNAVWQLDPSSAPGPDGFDGRFYRDCWSIIQWDVCSTVKEFFLGLPIPQSFSCAQIILIPKVENPSVFDQFRPICLTNFKVCTRILANRIAPLLDFLISPKQASFMKGRSIHSQILLANEMIHEIGRKARENNIAIKLDIAKAFDRVSWSFLEAVLFRFGFSQPIV
ncbi:uncharacterized protein LOC119370391 [Jatropha curcas]|uniref:uncharacterized protein LOC119370391 n=1 Tax=Jatropha curcas TaxID=180498 RepID=UPI0018949F1F|nr:uncharacterized protein LOC119370391 [Jatropha curcas]